MDIGGGAGAGDSDCVNTSIRFLSRETGRTGQGSQLLNRSAGRNCRAERGVLQMLPHKVNRIHCGEFM